ncbi:universal stress protein [Deinococcus ruber]|uniref:Universal stress protein n=1 Tax=Deinococcus ruber TaxID=1848197 RepID=A0A918KVH2_9DEIO|nr:universal stress protein [Deinococcus ruber]GGR35421.1 universal stress protein [Deinococcus ruber]
MYQRVLVPMDGSTCSEQAASLALSFAARLGAEVQFLYVAFKPSETNTDSEWERTEAHLGEMLLEHWARQAAEKQLVVGTRVELGSVPECIVRAAETLNCDLIIMGTHGRSGMDRVLLGSVAERVSRLSTRPLLLVRPGTVHLDPSTWTRLLIPLDGSTSNANTLQHATELAASCQLAVHLVSMVPDLPTMGSFPGTFFNDTEVYQLVEMHTTKMLEHAEQQLRKAGVTVEAVDMLQQRASQQRIGDIIVSAVTARNADLIVMGAHGHGGLDRLLLGSVAERVTLLSPVPVLLIKEPLRAERGAHGSPTPTAMVLNN